MTGEKEPSGKASGGGSEWAWATMLAAGLGSYVTEAVGILNLGRGPSLAVLAVATILVMTASVREILYLRRSARPKRVEQQRPTSVTTRPVLTRLTVFAGQVLVIGAALAVLVAGIGWAGRSFAAWSRPPEGASDAAVLAVVKSRIQSCAKAGVFDPSNCPQRFDDPQLGRAVSASWALYGDPMDGARVEWSAVDKEYTVSGNAVMVISYVKSDVPAREVVPFGYRAIVTWQANAAVLGEFEDLTDEPGKTADLVKKRSTLPVGEFKAAVKQAFVECAALRVPNLPTRCPVRPYYVAEQFYKQSRWTLTHDPLLNSTTGYDDRYGLVTVAGDYALRHDFYNTGTGEKGNDEFTGHYEATLIAEGEKITVLAFEDL